MALKSQLLRVSGAGTVGIGPRNIDYEAQPKLVGTLEGQGGATDIGGLPLSVHVTGSWDDPQTNYALDGANLADLASNPEALVSTLSNLGAIKDPAALADQLGGGDAGLLKALQGLGGGGSEGGSGPADALKSLVPGTSGGDSGGSSPADVLKSLIPGGGSSDATPTAPATETPSTEQPAATSPTDVLKNGAGGLKKLFGQ
jgi:AsmA protein